MTTGVIVNEPSPDWRGDTLAADADSGDTVLSVTETLDFDDDATRTRWLVVGDSDPLEYVDVDSDALTVTLADPLVADYEAGLPVMLWDPTVTPAGAKVVEYLAPVQLSDGSGTPDAVVPHTLIPLSGIANLVGATVGLVEDGGEWYVDRVFGREPIISGTTLQTAEEGQRVVITKIFDSAVVLFYTGDDAEEDLGAGYVTSSNAGFGSTDILQLGISSPTVVGGSPATLSLNSADDGVDKTSYASLVADRLTMNGELEVTSLADGGSQNQNSGTKYVRAGAGGSLFSSTVAPSSRTIKHDIQPLDLDPDKLLQLRPVTYRYNEAPDTVRVGFIAEEAHDLGLGPLVGYEDHADPERPTGFDYDGVTAALLSLVQRQEARIVALEARLAGGSEDASHGN